MKMGLPVIDLEPYLLATSRIRASSGGAEVGAGAPGLQQLCESVSSCLKETGALVVRDPRCSPQDNDRFLDMMERYFQMPPEFKRQQERPELRYQVGVTPEGVEVPRCTVDKDLQLQMQRLAADACASIPLGADKKWRYMWRIGPRPSDTRFKELNAGPVVPDGFPEWKAIMDGWGQKMLAAVEVVAEMAAIGFGLPCSAFTSLMSQGPHLLAPTGSDLSKYCEEGTVFAGYHYDLNFLTIHGRSRFPGLSIWLKQGQKVNVQVPPGCLLLQAGKQLEWLTGGECTAGMHEVVLTESSITAIEAAKREGRSLWRVSSTVFAHIASDAVIQPLGHFSKAPLSHKYPPTYAGEYVESEIAVIKLREQSSPHKLVRKLSVIEL